MEKISTIKLSNLTKQRLLKLKGHKRDSFEDIIANILEILNTCRNNPEKARVELIHLDKKHIEISKSKIKEKPETRNSRNQEVKRQRTN